MNRKFRILTIIGSPHDTLSNTRALVEDFVDEMAGAGLNLEHEVISLGRKLVKPCKGCWICAQGKLCPLKDNLQEIKGKMIDCDLLILGSPVYTNQVTAQMKALFDRLFTWCHTLPLLGKYSVTACTTGQEGMKPVRNFLQKMLATYGTFSLGNIESSGGFTPGFFPFREKARKKNKKLAKKAVDIIKNSKKIPVSYIQKKMFKIMYRKISGFNIFKHIAKCDDRSDIIPSSFKLKIFKLFFQKNNITDADIKKISQLLNFEYNWWKELGWLKAKSFKDLLKLSFPENFNKKERLLGHF